MRYFTAVAEDGPAAQPPPPHQEDLGDIRALVARGKFADAALLSDRVTAHYEQVRDASQASQARSRIGDSCMVCYCLFVKAQVLALKPDAASGERALAAARDYHAQHQETQFPSMADLWQELDSATAGLIEEARGDDAAASQAYLQTPNSPKSTGRLAFLEFKRGHFDQARTWAFIHADDPTSELVLAQIAIRSKNLAAARQHVDRAWEQLLQAQKGRKELMPLYFCVAPQIAALRAKLPKPAAPKPSTAPPLL
jgi:hypothetical protein